MTHIYIYIYISQKGLWGVECTLAVIGTGGPVKRSNAVHLYRMCFGRLLTYCAQRFAPGVLVCHNEVNELLTTAIVSSQLRMPTHPHRRAIDRLPLEWVVHKNEPRFAMLKSETTFGH